MTFLASALSLAKGDLFAMSHVITLIGATGAHDAVAEGAQDLVVAIKAAILRSGCRREACDIVFAQPMPERSATRRWRSMRSRQTPRSTAIFSLSRDGASEYWSPTWISTIIQQECLDEVAAAAGIGQKIAAITERAMRGELVFEDALRETHCAAARLSRGESAGGARPADRADAGRAGADGDDAGAMAAVLSSFPAALPSSPARLRKRAGFNVDYANRFVFEDGALTGVADPILGRDAKVEAMEKEAKSIGIGLE